VAALRDPAERAAARARNRAVIVERGDTRRALDRVAGELYSLIAAAR